MISTGYADALGQLLSSSRILTLSSSIVLCLMSSTSVLAITGLAFPMLLIIYLSNRKVLLLIV
jgi:hypothetical protein